MNLSSVCTTEHPAPTFSFWSKVQHIWKSSRRFRMTRRSYSVDTPFLGYLFKFLLNYSHEAVSDAIDMQLVGAIIMALTPQVQCPFHTLAYNRDTITPQLLTLKKSVHHLAPLFSTAPTMPQFSYELHTNIHKQNIPQNNICTDLIGS